MSGKVGCGEVEVGGSRRRGGAALRVMVQGIRGAPRPACSRRKNDIKGTVLAGVFPGTVLLRGSKASQWARRTPGSVLLPGKMRTDKRGERDIRCSGHTRESCFERKGRMA